MKLEWLAEDSTTLGHVSEIKIDGISALSPAHALTKRDIETIQKIGNQKVDDKVVIAGESIAYSTLQGVGNDSTITEALFSRIKSKMSSGKINFVHIRIPEAFKLGESVIPVGKISELQASGMVGIQLEANASAIMPPLPSGLGSSRQFETIYNRTKIENQTFRKEKDIVGYIPTTKELTLIPSMIKAYIKDGVRIFAVDFSSSPLNRWLIRTVVTAIRTNLKIRGKVGENSDKKYYLHVLNVSPSKRTPLPVSPMTDILTHTYGVDSTSGVIWGGGKLVKEKLRYYNMPDYGAYQIGHLTQEGIRHDASLLEGDEKTVYDKLRVHRLGGYKKESEKLSSAIHGEREAGLESYLQTKGKTKNEVNNILLDVREIQARG